MKKKLKLGAWFRGPLKMLASMRGLRGGALDVFGYSSHRKAERELINWYRQVISRVIDQMTDENTSQAIEIASLPDQIRGYETIKEESIARVKKVAEGETGGDEHRARSHFVLIAVRWRGPTARRRTWWKADVVVQRAGIDEKGRAL